MNTTKLTFIGGGNMAAAILEGCLAQGLDPSLCHMVEINPERRSYIEKQWHVPTHSEITKEIANCDVIILAVKPQQMQEVALQLHTYLKNISPVIISIAAGIRLSSLTKWLGNYQRLVRAMPNMAALIHTGITGLVALPSVNAEDRANTEKLMQAIGDTLWVEDENQLDAITAVSGSGPAYVFYFIEALQEAAESLGLTSEQAKKLALKTFEGASYLAALGDESARTLREKVTSKGGTTEAALTHMEKTAIKQHFIEAVQAAAKRSKALGN